MPSTLSHQIPCLPLTRVPSKLWPQQERSESERSKNNNKNEEKMKLGSESVPIISVPRLSLVSRFSSLPARPHHGPFSLPPLPSQNPNLTSLSLSSSRRCFHFRSHLSLLRSSSAAVDRFERRIATMGKRSHFQSYCSWLLWSLLFRLFFSADLMSWSWISAIRNSFGSIGILKFWFWF